MGLRSLPSMSSSDILRCQQCSAQTTIRGLCQYRSGRPLRSGESINEGCHGYQYSQTQCSMCQVQEQCKREPEYNICPEHDCHGMDFSDTQSRQNISDTIFKPPHVSTTP